MSPWTEFLFFKNGTIYSKGIQFMCEDIFYFISNIVSSPLFCLSYKRFISFCSFQRNHFSFHCFSLLFFPFQFHLLLVLYCVPSPCLGFILLLNFSSFLDWQPWLLIWDIFIFWYKIWSCTFLSTALAASYIFCYVLYLIFDQLKTLSNFPWFMSYSDLYGLFSKYLENFFVKILVYFYYG